MEIENKTAATITPVERIETPLWDRVAVREAVINALVHNDYTFEVPPKFEIFPDRLEITSAGRLPETMTLQEFYDGVSIPRNKELMRIYKDVELVESLGSGIPRILRAYGTDCFCFSANFIRLTMPIAQNSIPESSDNTTPKSREKSREKSRGKSREKSREKIVALMRDKPSITQDELAEMTHLSVKTIEKQIANLRKHGIIRRVGGRKEGYWEIL